MSESWFCGSVFAPQQGLSSCVTFLFLFIHLFINMSAIARLFVSVHNPDQFGLPRTPDSDVFS